jgi:hypothetical protein
MEKSRPHEWTNRCSHQFAWHAVQLHHWTRLAICSIITAVALALSGWPAAAQQDACKKLDEALLQRGMDTATYKAEKTELAKTGKPEPGNDRARQLALDELATQQSSLQANMGKSQSGPGETVATFEDKRIADLQDATKVCVRAFRRPSGSNDWNVVPVRKVFVTEKAGDTPKRLNVALTIDKPAGITFLSPSRRFTYVLVGALGDASPISFSHAEIVSVISKWCAIALTLLFVLVSYLFLVIVTYNNETRSLEGPAWLAYTLSPIRISAAWFGEASMSQVQLLVFTFMVAGLLFYHWLISRVLSEMSIDLLTLIGISAVGAGASKFAQTVKTSLKDQTARYLIGKGWYNWEPISARSHATLGKLLLTDGRLDIYKFQMAIFTVIVACYVISAGQANLVDVRISDTMLYLIGISQGVYVGGKAVTDRTTDLEAAVQKMIDLDSQIRALEAKLAPGAARPSELVALDDQYAKAAATAAVEFTALQNRKFPTKFDFAKRKVNDLGARVSALQTKVKGGATPTSDEQALEKEFEQVDMTAKEFEAFKEPERDIAVQDIKNIDPTVLKP